MVVAGPKPAAFSGRTTPSACITFSETYHLIYCRILESREVSLCANQEQQSQHRFQTNCLLKFLLHSCLIFSTNAKFKMYANIKRVTGHHLLFIGQKIQQFSGNTKHLAYNTQLHCWLSSDRTRVKACFEVSNDLLHPYLPNNSHTHSRSHIFTAKMLLLYLLTQMLDIQTSVTNLCYGTLTTLLSRLSNLHSVHKRHNTYVYWLICI